MKKNKDLKNYLDIHEIEVTMHSVIVKERSCILSSKSSVKKRSQYISSVLIQLIVIVALQLGSSVILSAQHKEKPRPEEWNDLAYGGRFMDRILPAPVYEGLECDTWGTDAVRPRDIHNGIEDSDWSYWGGKPVLGDDGKYHFFGCRWPEDSEKGHMSWPQSVIFHAVGDRPTGPFTVKEEIASGHFPEITRLSDGRWALFHFEGYYLAESLDGPWTAVSKQDGGFPDCQMGSVTLREDGSLLMFDRAMRVWIKENGADDFKRVTDKGIYPAEIPGSYEDPVVWRTEVQYHLIVNDWIGRTAYHLRSLDGINWKEDPGEAYTIDFDGYEDGTKVGWYKYERPKVLQDEYGRATHFYLAVIDTSKWGDLGGDNHSSKNISLPLVVGKRIQILNKEKITGQTKMIKVLVLAEEGFNPHTDMNLQSLRFGAPEQVDFGRGRPLLKTKKKGKDMILVFDGKGNGVNDSNFAGKLLGKTNEGKLLFGYASLPWQQGDGSVNGK